MDIKAFLLKYKKQSVVVIILVSILLGMGIMKKISAWLPYLMRENNWSGLPSWFDPYGVAAVGLLGAGIMIFLINWSFRKVLKSLEEQ